MNEHLRYEKFRIVVSDDVPPGVAYVGPFGLLVGEGDAVGELTVSPALAQQLRDDPDLLNRMFGRVDGLSTE